MRSLSLQPDDLLTIPWMALSIDSMRFVFLRACDPGYRDLTLTLVGLTPTEHLRLFWTYDWASRSPSQQSSK